MTIFILIYLIIVLLWSISVILFYALFSIFSLLLIFSPFWQLSFYRSRVLTLFQILELLILKWFHIMFSCSVVSDFGSPWTAACQASLFFTISRSLLKLMSIELMTPSNHLIFCYPLLFLPSSGSFPMSQLIASDGQSIRLLAWVSVLPMNIQDWFPLGFTDLISLMSKGLSRVFSSTTV